MKYRILGKTNLEISEIALGTWQVGGGWGGVFDEKEAYHIIHTAVDHGINFIDTADVYDAGLSEKAIGKALRERSENVYVATKCGRQIQPHVNEGYTPQVLRRFVEGSLRNMDLETLDLIQLHCPPTEVYQRDEIFELFDRLKEEGKIRNLGVSVEKVEEAKLALAYDNVTSVQIIFNMFRLKPSEEFFSLAKEKNVGIIVRVPLASGLLAGKLSRDSQFDPKDHRHFNRNGEAFDKGETFSGIDLDKGLDAVDALKEVFGSETDLAAYALKWILMFSEVSTVIPGASKASQVISNVRAAQLPPVSKAKMEAVEEIYRKYIKEEVHSRW